MAELDLHQKRQVFENGWVVIPQVVPAESVRAARSAIDSTVESYLDSIQVHAHELKTDERLTNLLRMTPAFSLVRNVGSGERKENTLTGEVRRNFQTSLDARWWRRRISPFFLRCAVRCD